LSLRICSDPDVSGVVFRVVFLEPDNRSDGRMMKNF